VKNALAKASDILTHLVSSHLNPTAQLRKLAFKIINSTTIHLPAWLKVLNELKMELTLLPRDVATRWNSMFDMLIYALGHKEAVNTTTQSRDLGLRSLELSDAEWTVLEQLADVLKVRCENGCMT
jgi:hypothetical protein